MSVRGTFFLSLSKKQFILPRLCVITNICNMNFLIVDDYPLMISKLSELVKEVLEEANIETSGSYTEATEVLEVYTPNVALLDINLPDKSGIELLKYIKRNSPTTYVLMVTNEGNDYYRKLCLSLGADYFIDKSKNVDDILSILEGLSTSKIK